jgi:hypothetical protein
VLPGYFNAASGNSAEKVGLVNWQTVASVYLLAGSSPI